MAKFILTIEAAIRATGGVLLQGDVGRTITGVSTDSRKIQAGDLFVALMGENFDGHHFVETAVSAGAAAILVMKDISISSDISVIRVSDTLQALGELAHFYKQQFAIPVIGITGSNGKTTTKDLIAAVLASELEIIKTKGNFNNEIGLPLTLFQISATTQAAVVEMGMRGLGEIRQLAEIARPNIGVITNVGLTHLEVLGSQANIAQAKSELVQELPTNGLAVLNGDDPLVREMALLTKARTVFYGIETNGLEYRATDIRTKGNGSFFKVHTANETFELYIPVPGRYNVLNALAAVAVAKELGISSKSIQEGLRKAVITGKRLNLLEHNGYVIIDDTYNASPPAVKAALDVLLENKGHKRYFAVLGDMLELGTIAVQAHQDIGTYAAQIGVNHLLAFGDLAKEYVNGFNYRTRDQGKYFNNKAELINLLLQMIQPDDIILVKGSRGMKMEEIVHALMEEEEAK